MSAGSDSPLPPLPPPDALPTNQTGAARPRSRWAGLLVAALLGIAGMGVGALLGSAAKGSTLDFNRVQKFAVVAGIIATLPLYLALHELGHLIGGWLAGFRFNLFVVGPLKILREGEAIRVRLNTNLGVAGGLAGCSPIGPGDHRRGMIMMVAGGPIASFVVAVIGLVGGLGLSVFEPGASGWPAVFGIILAAMGLGSLAIGLITLVPGRASGFMTDGARLRGLIRRGPETDREIALIALIAESAAGRRPREWDEAMAARAVSVPDGSLMDSVARQFVVCWARDRGDLAGARDFLAGALDLAEVLPASVRPALFLEAAEFEASVRGDSRAARRWLDHAGHPGGLVPRHLRPMAEAAVLIAEGNGPAALPLIAAARERLQHSSDPGTAAFSRDELDAMDRRARATILPDPDGEASIETRTADPMETAP